MSEKPPETKMCTGDIHLGYRDHTLRTKFGITIDQYHEMSERQGHKCAICDRPKEEYYKRGLAVDHDHKTNKVRALLCGHCNTGLGAFHDSPGLLMKAIAYLVRHSDIKEVG